MGASSALHVAGRARASNGRAMTNTLRIPGIVATISLGLALATSCGKPLPPPAAAGDPVAITGEHHKLEDEKFLQYAVGANIAAPAETVWAILTDSNAYLEWNSTLVSFEADDLAQDVGIALVAKVNEKRTFKMTVVEFEPNAKMVWEDGNNSFKGRRTFTLTKKDDGTTDFTMKEQFTGSMMNMIAPKLPDFGPAFEDFAADLKNAAERQAADAFVKALNEDLKQKYIKLEMAAWDYATDITDEHAEAEAKEMEVLMGFMTSSINQAKQWDDTEGLDFDTRRQLDLLKAQARLPAPADDAKRAELSTIASDLGGMYGKGKYCKEVRRKGEVCRDLGELSDVIAESRDYDELLDAWQGWRTVSPAMREKYQRFVELGNEGAQAIGYDDMGAGWRSAYDMPVDDVPVEVDRLFEQVKPLYEELHCHVRAKLAEQYGEDKVPLDGPIPAHLLGNMWAQSWENVYPLVEPYPGQPSLDVTAKIVEQEWDSKKMVRTAESFFTSLGLDPLPDTFWERSMFDKPEDRDVVCHASAWDPSYNNDLRIKMCIKKNMEDLVVIHHELGHNYYYHYYYTEPILYQSGAHDGFHEGIGDTLALSITPGYLKKIGLLDEVSDSEEAVINKQMLDALDGIAFLPFGRMIDQWRWDVFSGEIPPEKYNEGWWKLREKYQGVAAPIERTEADFDPGAKYHIPGNTPYLRYFLARILQYQFHEALCEASGHEGPLYTCSIYDSKEAGKKMQAMLAMGASKPWPDALEAGAGTREMDGSSLIKYYEPLMGYLKEQNKDRTCGW
jgi:peptidyl-dipeptidase A